MIMKDMNSEVTFLLEVSFVGAGVVLKVVFEIIEFSVTFKVLDLVVLRVELDGWVSSDADTFSLVSGGIEFGNDEIGNVLKFFSEVVPDRSECFTMAAPWSIEFDKDILGRVHCDFIEILSNKDGVSFGLFWNGIRLHERRKFVILEVLDE